MSLRRVPIEQTDLTRYAKAMAKAGVSDWAVAAETAGDKHVIRAAALAPLADPQG